MPADRLASEHQGAGERIVLVHGFTQTGRSWRPMTDELSEQYEVVTVDAPGHGDSAAIVAGIGAGGRCSARHPGGRSTSGTPWVGGCAFGWRSTDRISSTRLVLVSTTAGIDDEAERANRQAADETLAAAIERDGVDQFLRSWVAQPLFATLDDPDLDDRRRNSVSGLASSLRMAGTGAPTAALGPVGELRMPVLVIAGALDTKFVDLAERLAAVIPNATLAVVEGAGHAVHLERPADVLAVVKAFLSD